MNAQYKLGKMPATYDKRDLQFSNYRTTAPLPPYPKYFGHEQLIPAKGWQMLGNGPDNTVSPGFQGAGDCVFAGGDHETMLWTLEGGKPAVFTGANSIADYSAVTGYDPANPASDQGTDVRTALAYRQNTGLIDSTGNRHKVAAYLALEPGNTDHLYEALYLFGVVGIGIQFPSSAMDQFNAGKPWSVVSGASVEGGHYIPLVARRTNLECVTWGQIQQMTSGFYKKYCDEAWAILSPEVFKNGTDLEGFNFAQLQADLNALSGQ
ncbi:MAG: hypothetical protein P4L42_01035 [Desulfocapsaceae bacterium]|nr:hypothetical protein [Desulfocapsaceae bacterium]